MLTSGFFPEKHDSGIASDYISIIQRTLKNPNIVLKYTKPKTLCVMLGNMPQLLATEGVRSLYKVFIELYFSSYDIYGIFIFI